MTHSILCFKIACEKYLNARRVAECSPIHTAATLISHLITSLQDLNNLQPAHHHHPYIMPEA